MTSPTWSEKVQRLAEERAQALAAAERATDELRAEVVFGIGEGVTESEAARLAGVTRMTIRAWLGKR